MLAGRNGVRNGKRTAWRSGDFANDPKRASEAGKKGGEQSHGGQKGGSSSAQQGGAGNFANDREKASDAARRGGQS
jgi:general stress protein YciG